MSATLEWYSAKRNILICRLEGAFTVETYALMEGQLPMSIGEESQTVDVIVYLSKGATLPPLTGFLKEVDILLHVMPPNLGLMIGVGNGFFLTNPLSLFVARQFKRFYFKDAHAKAQVASSIASALELCQLRA